MSDNETISICAQEIHNKHHAKTLTASLCNLRECGSLCDITLVSNDTKIKAHRVVLAACSEYFHSMFTNGFCETKLQEVCQNYTKNSYILKVYSYSF